MGQQKPPHRKTDYRFQGGVDDAAEAAAGAAVAAPLVLAPEYPLISLEALYWPSAALTATFTTRGLSCNSLLSLGVITPVAWHMADRVR
ncbi:MAG: hypothetical protein CBD88_07750, partial [Flavobacteriales bacterium TMED228]